MGTAIDLTGMVFGKLEVLRRDINHIKTSPTDSSIHWICKCKCGNTLSVDSKHLRYGLTKSCGCYQSEVIGKLRRTHGATNSPEHSSWSAMRNRCNNPHCVSFPNYGGRGIKVCKEWDSFSNFLSDMGKRPKGTSIDRIDVDGNYCPANCKWSTKFEQAQNRRIDVYVSIGGITKTIAEWSRSYNVSPSTVYSRIRHGWSKYDAVVTPVKGRGKYE